MVMSNGLPHRLHSMSEMSVSSWGRGFMGVCVIVLV
jgi:hypothetical protein